MMGLRVFLIGVFCAFGQAVFGQTAQFIAAIPFHDSDARFGGFSGLSLSNNGRDMVALSDRGAIFRGRIVRDDLDAPVDIERIQFLPVRQIDGQNTSGFSADSEGLAMTKTGGVYISFEGFHRVRFYENISAPAQDIPRHPDFKKMQRNSSLEALAVDARGALYTLPERSGGAQKPFPLYRFWQGQWDIVGEIPRKGEFLVVGADFADDGRLYILERGFSWVSGFASRVRSFRINAGTMDADAMDEQVHLTTRWGRFDNLEGISLWRDKDGRKRITMVSDDNFRIYQRTELVEYVLGE